MPLKPAAALPGLAPVPNPKSGTTIVKSAPPKETARITVKPSLPGAAVKPGSTTPVASTVPVAAAAGAVAGAAAVKATAAKPAKPATTIVKTPATVKVATSAKAAAPGAVPVPAMPAQYQDEASTTLTTALAGVLAVLTWGTAGVLFASLYGLI